MENVYNNKEQLHVRRKSCFSIAKSHCDSEIVFNELLLLSKRTNDEFVLQKDA